MSELFTTFGINWQLLIVQAVNFGILLTVLWYFLYRPVSKMLEERSKKIADGVEAAEAAHEKLSVADARQSEIIAKAGQDSEAIIASARSVAKEKAEELVHSAQGRAEGIVSDASLRAKELQVQAMKESEKEIARVAILAAEKVLRSR